jgi:hypothetical protein
MKNMLFIFALLLGLAACTPAVATPTPTVMRLTTDTPTAMLIELLSATPTLRPTETPIPQQAEINPFSSSTTWPPEIQAQFKDVLSDPWTTTADEKAAFDTFLMNQWQLTLKADGVANVETLQGYDLLQAIIDYQPPITLTGNETPEQLASYVVELPFSLHELLRTDVNNLVGFHHEVGRYVEGQILVNHNGVVLPPEFQGPLQKSPYDLGYYEANYGFGVTTSPKPDHAQLLKDMGYLSSASTTQPNNNGFDFYVDKIPAIGVRDDPEGDLMFLFQIPGIDPNVGVGAMLRMYDGAQTRYTEAFLPLSTILTTKRDTCLKPGLGLLQTIPCPAGLAIQNLRMEEIQELRTEDELLSGAGGGSLSSLLKLMSLYNNNPHIELTTIGTVMHGSLWKDGIPVATSMSIPYIPKDFFTKP